MACLCELAMKGHTVIISSHTLSEVERLCDHIAIVRDGRIVEDSTVNLLQAKAPRQIVVTLRSDQMIESVQWPNDVTICFLPGRHDGQVNSKTTTNIAQSNPDRTCVLELIGSSASFIAWAAVQNFADIMIGPPSLEKLFRPYYKSQQEAV